MANPTYDQKRAKHAWALVQAVLTLSEVSQREFQIQAKRMPLRILASGLGQALALLEARDAGRELRGALADWIATSGLVEAPRDESDDLTDWIVWGDSAFLRLATGEALEYLQWVVRFADSLIHVDEDEDQNTNATEICQA